MIFRPGLNTRLEGFCVTRLSDWQARIALGQIDRLEELVASRRRLYAAYHERLRGCKSFLLPPRDERGEWACIRFPILVRRGDKLSFYKRAAARGVDFAFSFSFIASPQGFRLAHELASRILDLPFYEKLSDDEFRHVVSTLKAIDEEV